MGENTTMVWVPDPIQVFVQGELLSSKIIKDKANKEQEIGTVKIKGSQETKEYNVLDISPVNPSTFDKVDDMSELTHLNEASVLYNLENRYKDDLIYTYSGLFLVAINPYCDVKLYSQEYINLYHGSPKEDNKPHIFAIAEEAYRKLLTEKQDQSILVTGESGAGKTENTKKILQYLASITSDDKLILNDKESFELKILQSNPILESFGNSQTVRNNNSSRFGKFIKIEFDERGKINGAHIEWYLLEKSRVIHQNSLERNYHIFYQLLTGLSDQELRKLDLSSRSIKDYGFLKNSNHSIPGVDDSKNLKELLCAFKTVGFTENDITEIFKIISIILHIGNIEFTSERAEQASIKSDISSLCKLLGVAEDDFKTAILRPKSKAGKEWVSQAKNATQARFILNSLARTIYERLFTHIVARINQSLDHGSMTANFIGLLDIAGFEIFKHNSFEQLCINYTNEKLQQFFNHYMFVLEQKEYLKENIQWDYIDYGKDLQSTINIIEQRIPLTGFLPLLDEESILPKSTDDSFFSKLLSTWESKSTKFKRSKKPSCFILTHYAGDVEYNIEGWLSKNKDPLHENLMNVLMSSNNELIYSFFMESENVRGGSFRTTSSRHREQLKSLIDQLSSTNPHFARCIIPNNNKKAKDFDRKLILDQLRCNGVLEGIRIAREGYPNRIFFKEFFERYKILSDDFGISNNSKKNCEFLLSSLHLDPSLYKVGSSKLFFKAGVLADLESKKEQRLTEMMQRFTSIANGVQIRIKINDRLKKLRAARALGNTFKAYNTLMDDPWYNLYFKIKPLLTSSQDIIKTKKIAEQLKSLESKMLELNNEKDKAESEKVKVEKEKDDITKDLAGVRSLLSEETVKLNDQLKILEQANKKQAELEKRLNEAIEIKTQLQEENSKIQEEYKKSLDDVSKFRGMSDEEEQKFNQLKETNKELLKKLDEYKIALTEKEDSIESLSVEKDRLIDDISRLKQVQHQKSVEISALKEKLSSSEEDLNIKLQTLEKNCSVAMSRLQNLIQENEDLRNQLNLTEQKKKGITKDLGIKEREIQRMKDKIESHQSQLGSISNQRDETLSQHSKVVNELKETRATLLKYKDNLQSLERKNESISQELSRQKENNAKQEIDDSKINELQKRLEEEVALNQYLNEKISTQTNRKLMTKELQDSVEVSRSLDDNILKSYQTLKLKLEDNKRKLDYEIEKKKDLLSRLRFTEARLASSSFESQIAHNQVEKLKEIIKKSNLNVDFESELEKLKPVEANIEKLVLEVDHLKRQLEIETRARCDAEHVVSALHNRFSQIQRSDSSSDIYRLKYEASEERAKSLENKLRSAPLKDRTNIAGDIFTNRESISKYADEIRFHKLENYKLQEVLADSSKKIATLNHEIKQTKTKEVLLTEQLEGLQKDLEATERQNELMITTIKQQKQQYETCVNDLHVNEFQNRELLNNLRQAEEDVKSMAAIIDKLKLQNKQKDKTIWEKETEKNDLDMQLQETILEVKRAQEINKILNSDLGHLKERLAAQKDNSKFLNEIDSLKSEIKSYIKSESEFKKEISTLKYNLETTSNEHESRISELLKQIEHYESLVQNLSSEKDVVGLNEKELTKKLEALNVKTNSLSSSVDSLQREKSQLSDDLNRYKEELSYSVKELEGSLQQKHDMTNTIKNLEETLNMQRKQNDRNVELVKQLDSEVSNLKAKFKEEKEKNINLFEEKQSLLKENEQQSQKITDLEIQLADESETNAWLEKIHQLEKLVAEESSHKYDEMKKTKNLELIIQELQQKSENQAQMIEMAKTDQKEFDESVTKYNEQIGLLEKHIAKQELDLKKCVRDNAIFQNKNEELEREVSFWKERYNTTITGKGNVNKSRTNEVYI